MNGESNKLRLIRIGIDTLNEFYVILSANCFVCKSEGFETLTRVLVTHNNKSIVATLAIIHSNIMSENDASLSESAWNELGAQEGDYVTLSHLPPVTSFKHVRSKIFGHAIDEHAFYEIIQDIVAGKYSNVEISSFITACSRDNLDINEIIYLTKAMITTGKQIHWDFPLIMDKHSVGGIPGNRTTPIVVAVIAAAGMIIPKTSSRAITSPAGTADTVETMTPVDLDLTRMRQVIDKEGGCMVWGGKLGISPADDIIIRVERPLDLDPEGQMIASVLSKKAAVGATHVIIDIPVGPTAKIRSNQGFLKLKEYFTTIGRAVNLTIEVIKSDGIQPLGKGIGPALEAKDILAILKNDKKAPYDLKNKALMLAGAILELGQKAALGKGKEAAREILESGKAYKKFIAICEAQGGFREPPDALYTHDIVATHSGTVVEIDNRNLALVAKLAGAPHDPAAGIEFFAKQNMLIEKGQTLYRIHAQTKGGLEYSISFARRMPHIVKLSRE